MTIPDKVFTLILYGAFPILLFLLFWWGSIIFIRGNSVFVFAFLGLGIGFAVDWFIVKKRLSNIYAIRYSYLLLVYFFYSICAFGFFMGVPVGNVLLAPLAGLYVSRRIRSNPIDGTEVSVIRKRIALFTTGVMIGICALSAGMAISSSSTPHDIQGMLRLPFIVTWPMVGIIIAVGGLFLCLFTYFITRKTIHPNGINNFALAPKI